MASLIPERYEPRLRAAVVNSGDPCRPSTRGYMYDRHRDPLALRDVTAKQALDRADQAIHRVVQSRVSPPRSPDSDSAGMQAKRHEESAVQLPPSSYGLKLPSPRSTRAPRRRAAPKRHWTAPK